MVSVKCGACGHITTGKRTPRRCKRCGAKFEVVTGTLVYGEPQPKQKAAKTPPKLEPKGKTLTITPTPEPKKEPEKKPEPETEPYECAQCGAVLREGMENCPKCGVALDWPDE